MVRKDVKSIEAIVSEPRDTRVASQLMQFSQNSVTPLERAYDLAARQREAGMAPYQQQGYLQYKRRR